MCISMSGSYTLAKFCYLCSGNKSHTNQGVIVWCHLVMAIYVDRIHRSRTGGLTRNMTNILYDKYVGLMGFEGC